MGGFCPGGFCPGDFVLGGFCPGGFCPRGFCPGGFCPFRDQTEGTISATEPWYIIVESKITHKSDLNVHATYKV